MSRVKRGVVTHEKHKKVLKEAKGYFGRRKNTFRIANQAVEKSRIYAYKDRKIRKRMFRRLWIVRINAAARMFGTTYGKLIHALLQSNITLNRKILADLAVKDIKSFEILVKQTVK